MPLNYRDHRRDAVQRRYVYPVVSRRSRGVSVGINLSTSNQCNWRCAYCQVPGLQRGGTPIADLDVLERELDAMLADVVHGTFMRDRVPEGLRRLNDIAFSGNGEPLACPNFSDALERTAEVRRRVGTDATIVLITNGSYLKHPARQDAIARLGELDGEIWAKVDAGSDEDLAAVNGATGRVDTHLAGIADASARVRVRVQSCMLRYEGTDDDARVERYLAAMRRLHATGATIAEVQLYTLARPPQQGEPVAALSDAALDRIAEQLRETGYDVSCAYAPQATP